MNWAVSAPVLTANAAVGARFTVIMRMNSVDVPPSLVAIRLTV